ncbi:MAG: nickel pincer cofactor biosynthesis protein LarC [Verrucomicrobiia bacterium]
MKLLYLDCFSGISGDMFLGALLDLGVSEDKLRDELAKLDLHGYQISSRRVVKQNIFATKFDCEEEHHEHEHEHENEHEQEREDKHPPSSGLRRTGEHRGYAEITSLIEASALAQSVKRRALSVFRRIGEAEAKIHGSALEKIRFHEIGAVDSIVDIVGASVAVEMLGVDEVQASPPRLGSGFVDTAHGRFPIPAPATLELLKGVPTQPSADPVELVTPTGAAILAEFCTRFGPMPAMSVEKIGYGAGTHDLEKTPNVLRAVLGESTRLRQGYGGQASTSKNEEQDTVAVIETNIDDMNPQLFGDVMERLLEAGALDVFLTSVQMKKNRPGTLLTVLCKCNHVDRMTELLLRHTTSFGVRVHEAQRRKLAREIVKVQTRFGEIEVKIGRLGDTIVSRSPEFESCKQAAVKAGVAVKEVYEEACRVVAAVL